MFMYFIVMYDLLFLFISLCCIMFHCVVLSIVCVLCVKVYCKLISGFNPIVVFKYIYIYIFSCRIAD